ncbi:amino acid deaminase [Vibrio algivorus]|uniref:Amino acid deaminase n=1 Tax=Vibrio algivorus TaxID=1667024 RepID=A0A557PC11_9VIBR|nr:amino acid deaminase [Vibrio algivorus]TVO38201.1 amino acid deaminase [Vibrio algivorus]
MHHKNENNNHVEFLKNQKGMPAFQQNNGRYNLINEEVSLPCTTLKMSAVENNIAWMKHFAKQFNVQLAPHGKTSLTPAIISKQLEAGSWGMTMATIQQAFVAKQCGAKNIILANQLIGKANFELAYQLISQSECQLYICIDSLKNAQALSKFFSEKKQPLNVLIEIGVDGGRCGVREPQTALELATFISNDEYLSLQGIEFYEGVIHGANEEKEIKEFLDSIVLIANDYQQQALFNTSTPILTGAGSAFYDLVTEMLMSVSDHFIKIIRPGCYISHDRGIYQQAQNKVRERIQQSDILNKDLPGDLISAIEVWAYVQSRPEPNKAIVNVGKRDVAFDTELPMIEKVYRNVESLDINLDGIQTTDVMDQHMFVKIPTDCQLDVGDIVVLSTSHPCITFDKWRQIALVDDHGYVTEWVKTEF